MGMLGKMCLDSSAVALRMVLSSVAHFVSLLLLWTNHSEALPLLEKVVTAASGTTYWLVKVELCRLVGCLPFSAVHFCSRGSNFQARCLALLFQLLGDEDARVRAETASTLPALVENLYGAADESGNDVVASTVIEMSERMLHPILGNQVLQPTFAPRSFLLSVGRQRRSKLSRHGQKSVFRVVTDLHKTLLTSQSGHLSLGCIEALSCLSSTFPPALYPKCWGCHLPRTRRASAANIDKILTSPAFNLLSFVTSLLSKSSIAVDLSGHSHLLKLATELVASLACTHLGKASRDTKAKTETTQSMGSAQDSFNKVTASLLRHCVRVLSMVASLVEETPPPMPTTKAPLSIPNPTLSPLKKLPESIPLTGAKETDKGLKTDMSQETQRKMGLFSHSPHYVKIYDILKSTHHIHKTNLDAKSRKKFESLSHECLLALGCILDVTDSSGISKHIEEVLGYVKSAMSVDPLASLMCVQFLLKCIFKTNFASDPVPDDKEGQLVGMGTSPNYSLFPGQKGIFHPCFDIPRNELVHTFHLAREASNSERTDFGLFSTGKQNRERAKKRPPVFKALGKSADRAALSSYVRLFEPVVIRALKHYTLTTDAEQQGHVLQLLVQLVQLRVNYCLLDSDQIFIGYVIRQLELIEEGQVAGAEKLVPQVFRFLVLLSYEKYHSKPIIDVPKILRLCEGLFASGQPPEQFVLPALIPVAEDLFCYRGTATGASPSNQEVDFAELEAQREVVLSMLLKLAVHSEALQCLIMVISALREEGEEKWRKVSRTVMDVLLPLLANQKVHLDDKKSLDLVLRVFSSLSPGCLRPVDPFLSAVLTCAVDLSDLREVQRWLSFVVIALPIITHQSPEEGILGRLEELGIQVGSTNLPSPGSNLLDTSMESSSSTISDPLGIGGGVKPEVTLARFVIQVVGASCSKFHQLVFSQTEGAEADKSFLQQELSHLLLFIGHMLQSGRTYSIIHTYIIAAN